MASNSNDPGEPMAVFIQKFRQCAIDLLGKHDVLFSDHELPTVTQQLVFSEKMFVAFGMVERYGDNLDFFKRWDGKIIDLAKHIQRKAGKPFFLQSVDVQHTIVEDDKEKFVILTLIIGVVKV